MVTRYDFSRLGKLERTPNGGVRVPANVTRTGVLEYRRSDGSLLREWRPPEEVFAEDSLKTLRGITVVDGHPAMIDSDNWREHAIGHTGDVVEKADQFVRTELVVNDAVSVRRIDSGERKEISCGYRCELDMTSGTTPEGERYDAIQRNIRYNHVGLGPENWGRAGKQVALILDSGDMVFDTPPTDSVQSNPMSEPKAPVKIKLDGKEFDFGSEAHVGYLEAKADAADKRVKEAEAKVAEKEAELAKFDSAVDARVELVAKARRHLGDDFKADGKSNLQVMLETIKKADPEAKLDGKGEQYVSARFDMLKDPEPETKADSVVALVSNPTRGTKAAAKTIEEANKELWQKPLFYSRENLLK